MDGIDVRALPLEELRRRIGFVPQETFLFSGSLHANVAFGLAEDEAIESRVRARRACRGWKTTWTSGGADSRPSSASAA